MSTYYEILNVSRSASATEIKNAYHTLAKIYHPDLKTGNAEKFKLINEAYSVLSGVLSRRDYDKELDNATSFSNYTTSSYNNYDVNTVNEILRNQEKLVDVINTVAELVNKLAENELIKNKKENTFEDLTIEGLNYLSLDQLQQYEKEYRKRSSKIISSMSRKEKKKYSVQVNEINETLEYIQQKIKDKQVQKESEWYYSDPSKESIFTILFHFNSYRFENAIKALWKRWSISMFGAALVYLFALPFILLTKVLFFFRPSKERNCSIHWLAHIHNLMYRNHLITSIFWFTFLIILSIIRLTWTTLYVAYWIFKNIIKYLLLPLAILAGSIVVGCGRLFFFPKHA